MAQAVHPKRGLYEMVFNPLTVRWFEDLDASPAKAALLAAAPGRDLLDSLLALNELCRERIGDLLDDGMMQAAEVHRAGILWVGDETPAPGAGPAEVRAALVVKLQRNISLGVLEAVLVLESACHFGRDKLGLRGAELRRTLQESRRLYASLAVLHDQQERERLTFLTGREGYLEYPGVDYPDILAGRVRIGVHRFVVIETPDGPRLRFVGHAVARVDPAEAGPTMRCPAHQANPTGAEGTINDAFWDTLIELYHRSGRFD